MPLSQWQLPKTCKFPPYSKETCNGLKNVLVTFLSDYWEYVLDGGVRKSTSVLIEGVERYVSNSLI